MSVFQPIDDNITDFGDLTSVELFAAVAEDINYFIDSMPRGTVIPIITSIPGIPALDENIWKECDGTNIDNEFSPLRNTSAPNYADVGRYMKCYQNFGDIGNLVGSHTKNLYHDHGGNTGIYDGLPTDADSDNDYWTAKQHSHTITGDLGVYNFEPENIRIKHYIKINDTSFANTSRFKDLEKDFGTTIAQALWQKAARGLNSLNKSYPVGMVLFFMATQDNLPSTPDPEYWQLLDGSTVTNPNSPIVGQALPDFTGRYIRHTASGQPELSTGGINSINLAHDHGGQTGNTDDRNDYELDNGQERAAGGGHSHSISADLGVVSTLPAYLELQCYIRIV